MKYLLISSVLLSVKAFAFPAVGDYARYEARFRGEIMVMEKQLTSQNADQNTFTQVTRVLMKDEVLQEEIVEIASLWLYSREKVSNVLKNCLRREGAPGSIIIQGQNIKTCTFFNEESQLDYSIGMVPFGQVRFQVHLGGEEFLDFNLVKFIEK